MLPTKTDIKTQGDLGGQKISLGIDSTSLAHIMSLLTDLYSDPEKAVIREYSTNAYDSHKAAGINKPIEISLPSRLNNYFVVKDYGLGLNLNDLKNIYSQYGASTKRNTNDQVGMLGLGCKSALTYTNQFTMICIKDGKKCLVAISRTDDGTGTLEVIDEVDSNEPNGVEVCIPVKHTSSFINSAMNFFSFWEKGSVLINGEPPAPLYLKHDLGDNIFIRDKKDHNYNKDIIVMGNVAYPCDEPLLQIGRISPNFKVIAFVEIGDVSFTPSREALHYNEITKSKINEIRNNVNNKFHDMVQNDIDSALNNIDALEKLEYWSNKGVEGDFFFKGEKIVRSHYFPKVFSRTSGSKFQFSSIDFRTKIDLLRFKRNINFYIVKNFKNKTLSAKQRLKIKEYLTQNSLGNNIDLYFVDEFNYDKFVPRNKIIDWNNIAQIDITTDNSIKEYNIVSNETYEYFIKKQIDNSKPILYLTATQRKDNGSWKPFTTLSEKFNVVLLPESQQANLKKEYPNAQSLNSYVSEEIERKKSLITTSDMKVIAAYSDSSGYRNLHLLDENKLDDPELKEAIRLNRNLKDILNKYNDLVSFAAQFHIYIERPSGYFPFKNYPLIMNNLVGVDDLCRDHLYKYCNFIYAERKRNES